jgi:hypothetical protein
VAVHRVSISLDRDFARVAAPTVERVAQDPCLEHFRKLPSAEVEALLYCVLRHYFGRMGGDVRQMEACVRLLADVCFIRSAPLFEAATLLYSLRDVLRDIEHVEWLRAGVEPNGPEEQSARFFDLVVFELLKGY